jgi:hypothetical protein
MNTNELEEHLKFTMFNEVSYCKDFIRQLQKEKDELQIECDRLYRIIELNGTLK